MQSYVSVNEGCTARHGLRFTVQLMGCQEPSAKRFVPLCLAADALSSPPPPFTLHHRLPTLRAHICPAQLLHTAYCYPQPSRPQPLRHERAAWHMRVTSNTGLAPGQVARSPHPPWMQPSHSRQWMQWCPAHPLASCWLTSRCAHMLNMVKNGETGETWDTFGFKWSPTRQAWG